MLFSPISGYICTWLIKYSTSPLLPVGPAVLWEKGLYDSDRDSLCVAWKRRWGPGGALWLVFIHIPSSGSDNGIAGEKRPGPPPWALAEAQKAALPPWTEEMLPRSPRFAAWRHLSCDPPPAASTRGHARRQSRSCPSATWAASSLRAAGPLGSTPAGQALDAQRGSSPSLDAFESWGQRSTGVGEGLKEGTLAGWIDPSSGGRGQGEGMSWLLDVVLSCFFSPPACLCDVSLQESLMFSDPEYSRGRRLGRRRVSSSFFPTFFYKMWQLGLL